MNRNNEFELKYKDKIEGWFLELLEVNFKNYSHEWFYRQKGKDGFFEYSIEEIVEKIWS